MLKKATEVEHHCLGVCVLAFKCRKVDLARAAVDELEQPGSSKWPQSAKPGWRSALCVREMLPFHGSGARLMSAVTFATNAKMIIVHSVSWFVLPRGKTMMFGRKDVLITTVSIHIAHSASTSAR